MIHKLWTTNCQPWTTDYTSKLDRTVKHSIWSLLLLQSASFWFKVPIVGANSGLSSILAEMRSTLASNLQYKENHQHKMTLKVRP